MRINSIAITQPMTKNIKKNNQNFGMAYRIDNRWYETFNSSKECEFISDIVDRAKSGSMKYVSSDGLTFRFKCPDGDVLFMKEHKGLMPNVKFIPNKTANQEGFYIINNGTSGIDMQFKDMTRALNTVLKRDYQNTRPVRKVLKHNSTYNVQAKAHRSVPVSYVYAR